MNIQEFSLKLTGSFSYDLNFLAQFRQNKKYHESDWSTANDTYLNQKYYTNWLQSVFWSPDKLKGKGMGPLNCNHLRMNDEEAILNTVYTLECSIGETNKKIKFGISSIEVLLLRENIGIFIIAIDLDEAHWNWEELTAFTSRIRMTVGYGSIDTQPILTQIIEENIAGYFHAGDSNWQKFHPQLKSIILIDVGDKLESDQMDHLLYHLATFTNPFAPVELNDTEDEYLQATLNENIIRIFSNWRAICLEDSLVRVAINLKDKDKFKLWETEYIWIYLYVFFARHYLYRCNATLVEVAASEKRIKNTRNNFIQFMNEFEFTRISYKFLPNTLYQQVKKSLQIDDEIEVVEKEIARINTLFKEQADARLSKIILALTGLTLISVSFDSGQLFIKIFDPDSSSHTIVYVVMFLIVIFAFALFLVLSKSRRN